jgi:hypothetical protein
MNVIDCKELSMPGSMLPGNDADQEGLRLTVLPLMAEERRALKHDAEKWKPLFSIMLNFLESITFMRFDPVDHNAS